MLKRILASLAYRLLRMRLVAASDLDADREELAQLRVRTRNDILRFNRLNDVVNRYAYGPESTPETRELMQEVVRVWKKAGESK